MAQLFWNAQKEADQSLSEQRLRLEQLSELEPDQAAHELKRYCPFCGELLIPKPINGMTRRVWVFSDQHGCNAESDALKVLSIVNAEKKSEDEKRARRALLNRAGLIGWLGECDFDNFQPREDWSDAMEYRRRVITYLQSFIAGTLPISRNWLILHGNYGTGKSHLAAAVIKSIITSRRAYFRVWSEYLQRITATFDNKNTDENMETEADIIEELRSGDLIVIDDIDKRRGTDWSRQTLYSVLNYRYNAQLPTILTFNYGPGDVDSKAPSRLSLEEHLGRAVLDRIIGVSFDVIEFNGPSYRSGVALSPS